MVATAGVAAQASDHSGTWRLNREASQITKGAGLTGLGAGGVPPTLYVAQAANGTAVVGSDINESAAKLYHVSAKGLVLERDNAGLREETDGRPLRTVAHSLPLVIAADTEVQPRRREDSSRPSRQRVAF
jgi:UDP-N-acetyl-D-mannosaminuronate dehydrogenase